MENIGKLRCMTALYLLHGDRILLLFRQGSKVVGESWVGSAGGHFEEHELGDARACVLRELKEELGLEESALRGLELRYIAMRRTEKEIRQNYYFFAHLDGDEPPQLSSNEGILRWSALDALDGLPMPYTARGVIDHYLRTGRYDHKLYAGIANDSGVQFIEMPVY